MKAHRSDIMIAMTGSQTGSSLLQRTWQVQESIIAFALKLQGAVFLSVCGPLCKATSRMVRSLRPSCKTAYHGTQITCLSIRHRKRMCEHFETLELKDPKGYECEECIKTDSQWLHLRTCQSCGVTLCCDSSPNKHATKHYNETSHPVVKSAEPGENWVWCYPHQAFAKLEE